MADVVRVFHEVDEVDEVQNVVRQRRERIWYRERINPFRILSENEFKRRYRLTKKTARFVINLITNNLQPIKERRNVILPELQVLVTPRFFAKACTKRIRGFTRNLTEICNIVRRVSVALAGRVREYVRMPDDLDVAKRDFYRVAEFPSVVAYIDCTHVKIINPDKNQPLLYCNRKGWHSLNVQVACDAKCRIVDLVVRWRGSAHDARIWDGCTLKQRLEVRELNGLVLADSGYPCIHYLLTPLLNPTTPAELRYNSAHIHIRTTVKRCFGIWKATFRALQNGMLLSLDTVKAAIVAMAIIHNIRIDRQQNGNDSDLESTDDDSEDVEQPVLQPQPPQNQRGSVYRPNFIQRHFT